MSNQNTKIPELPSQIQRLYYTAFLYSNYALRHIEREYPTLTEKVSNYKKTIIDCFDMINKENDNKIKVDIKELFDYLIESYCYLNSEQYGINLFSGAILKRYASRSISNYKNIEAIKDVLINSLENDSDFIQIIKLSLKYGVYVTHLDDFRNDIKSINLFSELTKEDCLKHLFYKDDMSFWGTENHVKYEPTQYSPFTEEEIIKIYDSQRDNYLKLIEKSNITKDSSDYKYISLIDKDEFINNEKNRNMLHLYIPIYESDFNIIKYLKEIKCILIANQFEDFYKLFDERKDYQCFIELFFKNYIKNNEIDEMVNRVVGLYLWDEVINNKKNLDDAFIEFANNNSYKLGYCVDCKFYNSEEKEHCKRKPICNERKCDKTCYKECNCNDRISKIYDNAKKSIEKGIIFLNPTSKKKTSK